MKKKYNIKVSAGILILFGLLLGHAWLFAGGRKQTDFDPPYTRARVAVLLPPDSVGVLYVDSAAASGGNGESWEQALTELSDALQQAHNDTAVNIIRVAAGTYYPTGSVTGTNRDSAFAVLRGGLRLLGGYDAQSGQRDVENNRTVLSGNIGNPDDSTDNSYHVMVIAGIGAAADSIVIDGFSIREANADGGSTKTFKGLAVQQNNGGGVLLHSVKGPLLIAHCRIARNTADQWGGGLYLAGSAPHMVGCTILHNRSAVGGGLLNDQQSAPRLVNCTIAGNTVWQNSGGGVFNNHSDPQFINCLITANASLGSNGGGGLRNYASSPILVNTTVTANQSSGNGAGIRNNSASSPRIYNSVIWNNTREGALDNLYNDDANNDRPWFYCSYLQREGASWSWGGQATGVNGGGNLVQTETPFVDAAKGNYHLKGGSLAINAGDNDSIPSDLQADLDGNSRIFDGIIDMGAYEYQAISIVPDAGGIVYVDSAAAPGGSGDSWQNALPSLRQALEAANANSAIGEIRVATGHYYPTGEREEGVRDLAFALLRGGLKLRGGYDATTGNQDVVQHATVLSGDIGLPGDSTDNSYHVLVLSNLAAQQDSILIEGFTVTGGNADGSMSAGKMYNGLLVVGAHGAGMYMDKVRSPVVIRQCYFSGNTALNWGGALYISDGSVPRLEQCTIAHNRSLEAGGGVLIDKKSGPVFIGCILVDNTAVSNSGGAMFNNDSHPSLVNCVVSGNRSEGPNGSGGLRNFKSATVLINCVVANNKAPMGAGGGIRNNGGSVPVIANSIFWNNSSNGTVENIHNDASTDRPELAFTFLQGDSSTWQWDAVYSGTDGGGNLIRSISPFINADSGNFHLVTGSPAINGGNNDAVPADIETDLGKQPRFVDGSVDMGVYEDQNGPVMVIIQPDEAGIVYVSDSAAPDGNGSSWQQAVCTLSDALQTANHKTAIKEIRIAGGVYYPTGAQEATVRDSAFVIARGGLKLTGGYEPQSGVRKIKTQSTILSGDIGLPGDSLDNSYHVVVVTAMDTAQDEILLDGLTIRDGQADGSGMHFYGGRAIAGHKGGGVYLDSVLNNFIVQQCTLVHNTADSGGGIFCGQGSAPWVSHGLFLNNTAVYKGGGAYVTQQSAPWLINTAFYSNGAGDKGGALYNDDRSTPFITNTNFYGNTAGDKGSAIYNNAGSDAVISNTIIYGNHADGLYNHQSTPVLVYSIVQGIQVDSARHVYAVDPAFMDTANGNFHLQAGSPAIDAGSDSAYTAAGGNLEDDKDVSGIPRLYGRAIDMGVHEFFNCPGTTTLHVNASAAAGGDGSSWGQSLQELSQALQIAAYCPQVDSILVAKGTYYPTGSPTGTNRDSAFVIRRGGLVLLGGYDGSNAQRDPDGNETILSGNIGSPGDSLDNSYHVLVIASLAGDEADVSIDGFTISGGNADPNEPSGKRLNGQWVYRNNGGGIYMAQVLNKTVIAQCRIRGNSAYFGGGMFNVDGSMPQLINCIFSGNRAAFGGAMTNGNASAPQLVNCVFTGNTASFEGGAIANTLQSSPDIINCTITANLANEKGGGIYNGKSSPALIDPALNNNTCSGLDWAEYATDYSAPNFSNTIVWGNGNGQGDRDNIYSANSARSVYRNNYLQGDSSLWDWSGVSGGIDSSGNIITMQSPFDDMEEHYHLDSGAWAIDAGRNDLLPQKITADAAGGTRIVNAIIDMGAFEFNLAAPMARILLSQPEDVAVCVGETAVFEAQAGGPHLHYRWQYSGNGIVWRNIPRANAAKLMLKDVSLKQDSNRYRMVVTSASRSDTSRVALLFVHPHPNVSITADRPNPVPADQFVRLAVTGGFDYRWQAAPGLSQGDNRREVAVVARQAAEYRVTATDSNGCSTQQQYVLRIETADSLEFPNILTPNGDGINDQWVIPHLEQYPGNVLQVFNRAGRLVYRKKNYANDWTGTFQGSLLPTGTYYFIFTVGNGKKIYKGFIHLIHGQPGQAHGY